MPDFALRLSSALRRMYDLAAVSPAGLLQPVPIERGHDLLSQLGYSADLLAQIPPEMAGAAFPCACPMPVIAASGAQSLLDLGCGLALDALVAARTLPKLKRIVGLDQSETLLEQAERLQEKLFSGPPRLKFLKADLNQPRQIEEVIKDEPPFDLIMFNGSFNLVVEKARLLKCIRHFMQPDGRLLIYDFILTEELPAGFSEDLDNWLWNIGGALSQGQLQEAAQQAFFEIAALKILEEIDPVSRAEIVLRPVA